MDNWKKKFIDSIKEVEYNDKGELIRIKGYIQRNSDEL